MRLTINKDSLITFLALYVIGISVWDYTLAYQIALVAMFVFTILVYKLDVLRNTFLTKAYALLFIYFVVHTKVVGSASAEDSSRYFITMGINLAATICFGKILTSRTKIEKIMRIFVWMTLCVCLYVIVVDAANLFSGSLSWHTLKPFSKEAYGHNEVAILAAISVMFLVYFKLEQKRFPIKLPLIIFFGVFVILTGARRSFLLLLVAAIVYPLLFSRLREPTVSNVVKTGVKAGLVAVGILIAFFAILENEFLYEMIGSRFEGVFAGLSGDEFLESSAVSRDVMLRAAWELVLKNPWVGYGLNSFRAFEGSFSTWSHNNYLELWVSGGIIAVVIYYSFYIYAMSKLVKMKNDYLAGLFFSYMLFTFVNDFIAVTYVGRTPLMMLALVEAYIRFGRKESQ